MTTLVGYVSAHGSTRAIAERLAARLAEQGMAAEARAMSPLLAPGGYQAFVLGSAIHGGNWLPAAADFLRRHRAELAAHPVWLFGVSTVGERSSVFPPAVAERLRRITPLPPAVEEARDILRPRDYHSFAGVIDSSDWGLAGRVFMKSLGGRYGDHRNWGEIDEWAHRIGAELLGGAALAAG